MHNGNITKNLKIPDSVIVQLWTKAVTKYERPSWRHSCKSFGVYFAAGSGEKETENDAAMTAF